MHWLVHILCCDGVIKTLLTQGLKNVLEHKHRSEKLRFRFSGGIVRKAWLNKQVPGGESIDCPYFLRGRPPHEPGQTLALKFHIDL